MVDLDSIRGVDSARSAEAWNGIGRTVLENVNELRRVFDPSSGMTYWQQQAASRRRRWRSAWAPAQIRDGMVLSMNSDVHSRRHRGNGEKRCSGCSRETGMSSREQLASE